MCDYARIMNFCVIIIIIIIIIALIILASVHHSGNSWPQTFRSLDFQGEKSAHRVIVARLTSVRGTDSVTDSKTSVNKKDIDVWWLVRAV